MVYFTQKICMAVKGTIFERNGKSVLILWRSCFVLIKNKKRNKRKKGKKREILYSIGKWRGKNSWKAKSAIGL